MCVVRDSELVASLDDSWADSWVVQVTDTGEQMVLDLVVQSPANVGPEPTANSPVGAGEAL